MSTVIRSTQHLPPVNRWVAARIWAHSYPRASMTRRSAFKIRHLSSKPLNPAPIHHQNAESKDGKAERTVTAIRPEQSEEIKVRKFATTKPLGYTPSQISQSNDDAPFWNEFRASYETKTDRAEQLTNFFPSDWYHLRKRVVTQGFLQKITTISKNLSFAHLNTHLGDVQVVIQNIKELGDELKKTPIGSSVKVFGTLQPKKAPKGKAAGEKIVESKSVESAASGDPETSDQKSLIASKVFVAPAASLVESEILATQFRCVNRFDNANTANPADTSVTHPPQSRHLQIRYDEQLQRRLQFRSKVVNVLRSTLDSWQEVETPVLFKSTPEGAREFLVPTRRKGFAYALPQSPQQYKQILMASGVNRYFQFARCFRDEDMRADRQPEFTQLDLEMAWADGRRVRGIVENRIRILYSVFKDDPMLKDSVRTRNKKTFQELPYKTVMSHFGTDKPDLRIKGRITRIDGLLPKSLQGMLAANPDRIDAWRLRTSGSVKDAKKFVSDFLDSPEATVFNRNPEGAPGVCIYDPAAPLEGMSMFGFEGAEAVKQRFNRLGEAFEEGDIIFLQSRYGPLQGGSTMMGKLRVAIHTAAVKAGLVEQPTGHHYLWVTDFPMFTPDNGVDPGQGGSTGLSATHHPFTAPASLADINLLRTNPRAALADHYDLVVNGIELGGGSRRIHNAEMQKYIMRDILGMSEERMSDFSHLFDALAAGCPPHAGFAIGFDRLIAVMTGCESVKDVIAFPKSSKGEDLMVGSPSLVSREALGTYHLKLKADGKEVGEGEPVKEQKSEVVVDEAPSTS